MGGGPTGVETTGALAELMHAFTSSGRLAVPGQITSSTAGRLCRDILRQGPRLLAQEADRGRRGRAAGAGVTAIHPDHVEFSDGSTIPARTVVWGGGESGSAVAQGTGPSPGRGGRLDVRPDLTVDGFPGAYAVGDVANIPPMVRMGGHCRNSGRWRSSRVGGRREHCP